MSPKAVWAQHVKPEHLDWTWKILKGLYTHENRHYHNMFHIWDCLDLLKEAPGLGELERRTVEMAILWHDAVYIPGDPHNEWHSRNLFMGIAHTTIYNEPEDNLPAYAATCIMDTRAHQTGYDQAASVVIDLDLSVLGGSDETYDKYVSNIRKEYHAVSDQNWATGRSKFLRKMLGRESIYMTPYFQGRFEEKAIANIERELEYLDATYSK